MWCQSKRQSMGNNINCSRLKNVQRDHSTIAYGQTPSGHSLLCNIIEEKEFDSAQYLARLRSKLINVPDKMGDFPLHVAVREDAFEIAKVLLAGGAIPNVKDKLNLSPLEISCYMGKARFVKLLLENGASEQGVSKGPMNKTLTSALKHAVQGKNEECIELLLKSGASPDIGDTFGTSALVRALAVELDFSDRIVLDMVQYSSNLHERELHGATHLSWAIYMNRCSVACAMLKQMSSCPVSDLDYQALLVAIDTNCTLCFRNLLKYRGESLLNYKPEKSPTALQIALDYSWRFTLQCGNLQLNNSGPHLRNTSNTRLDCAEILIRDYGLSAKELWFKCCLSHQYLNFCRQTVICDSLSLCISAYGGLALPPGEEDKQTCKKQNTLFQNLGKAGKYTLMMKLYEAGLPLNTGNILAIHHQHEKEEKSTDIIDELNTLIRMPRTLKNLAVIQIRCCLETNVIYKTKLLPLPITLHKTVTLGL